MDRDYWHKQTADTPLYPDMLWSRPENRLFAGKLLIIGGNIHGFAASAEAYSAATAAGIGTARMYLPDSLHKLLGKTFDAGEFGRATPSGSFSQLALAEALAMGNWADGVQLAGDLGRNSETAIFLEKFAIKHPGQLTIAKDAADYYITTPDTLLARPDTLLVISMAQLQKLAMNAKYTTAFTFDMDILRFVDALHAFTELHGVNIIVKHLDNIFAASAGQVSSTRLTADLPIWRVRTAGHAATWWLQNPSNTHAALTTAVFDSLHVTE
ncbi:MAG TPA: hypothetical protein VF575_00800 [Candidatus Saccharimonadales bacterium]|jgi:hypothetical protein